MGRRSGFGMVMGVALTALLTQGCGEEAEAPSLEMLTYEQVQGLMIQGPEAFEIHFDTIRGKKVDWSGTVVEVVRAFGDDYAEIGWLYVDVDGTGQEGATTDVMFEIKPSRIKEFSAGQKVKFQGTVREFAREGDTVVLKLQVSDVN